MKMKKCLIAILATALLSACATAGNMTMRGKPAEVTPPVPARTVAEVPQGQSTYHYMVDIYPGLENFDPNPTLTLEEFNDIKKLDWYCADKTDEFKGMLLEMSKQGLTYGIFQGALGAIGYTAGFGSMIKTGDYLAAIGITALGGGLGSGKITFDTALNVAHGYCMTGMVYKADELEGKLRRVFIVPVYTGKAKLPEVSDKLAPVYPQAGFIRRPPPP